jgi:hypothetical protein
VRTDSHQENRGKNPEGIKKIKLKYKFQRETEDRGSQNLSSKSNIPITDSQRTR